MKVTKGIFKKLGACPDGAEYGLAHLVGLSYPDAIRRCIKDDKLNWANWGITRVLSRGNKIRYAIYAAKKAIKMYEDKYPGDARPRNAIRAAEKYLKNPTKQNAYAADAAYAAACAAACAAAYEAAYAAYEAACAAAYAARAAAYAAAYAADAACAAAYAARAAAYAARAAAYAAYAAARKKILHYGIRLLEKESPK